MKKLLIVAMVLLLSVPVFAVPFGGPGISAREGIRGTLEVSGAIKVVGLTVFNRISYNWPSTQESGTYLKNEGKGKLSWQKEIVPGGSNGALQFNLDNSFAGDPGLLWDNAAKTLKVDTGIISNGWMETADLRSKTLKTDSAIISKSLEVPTLRSNDLTVAGPLDAKTITQAGVAVSLSGHTHSTADLTSGILGAAHGGTGSDNGSISGSGALTFSAGGSDQNITLIPSGNGRVVLQGGGLNVSGAVRSDSGFNQKGADGISENYVQVTDIRLNADGTLQKKVRTINVSGGIITGLGAESDWADAGKISIQPKQ